MRKEVKATKSDTRRKYNFHVTVVSSTLSCAIYSFALNYVGGQGSVNWDETNIYIMLRVFYLPTPEGAKEEPLRGGEMKEPGNKTNKVV